MGELYQQAVRLTNPACVCTYAADLVYNPSEFMNKKMPLKQPGWNFRSRACGLLICGLLLLASCNFPIRDFSALPRPYATLDPAIFEYHRSATPTAGQPGAAPTRTPQPPPVVDESLYHIYTIRSGDTFETVARHFSVTPAAIISMEALPQTGILPPGRYLVIPKNTDNLFEQEMILPDSAVINSPCAAPFDISAYVSAAGGYLSTFSQPVAGIRSSGAEIVRRVADNQSVNPMLLLAILEHRAGLVFGKQPPADINHPLGFRNMYYKGLYQELSLAA
ncbi:MAG TPA: LysM peptidoglycan-binding domain-containing protein, partial [Anaerolineaceae bacterium]|nr:LysM peptidoglycan-binding domain-containing protein [Anaerolineaceae bacterium]